MMMMANEASEATTTTTARAGGTAARAWRPWAAALFSVAAAAVAILLATAGAASAYTPPSAPVITAPAEGSYDSDGNFVLSGTAQPNSAVKVFEEHTIPGRDPIYVGTAKLDPYGRWSLNLGGVVFGKHSYKARVTDHMSNVSDWSNSRTVSVDPPRLLQEQDTVVQQAGQESKQLVEEAEQQNVPQELQNHYAQIWQLSQDFRAQSWFVATMPVGGVSATEEAAANSQHAALEKSLYEMEQAVRERNNELLTIQEEMRRILERCASACSAEDRERLDYLKQQIDDLSSSNQMVMLRLQKMIEQQQNAIEVTTLMKKAVELDYAIIRNMTA